MSTDRLVLRARRRMAVVVSLAALVALAGCGSKSSSTTTTSASTGASSSTGSSSSGSVDQRQHVHLVVRSQGGSQGDGHADQLGAIATKQPGTDFTEPQHGLGVLQCVNDNGGINGHPLRLFVQFDQTQPAQIAAAAHQLTSTDHVVGIRRVRLLECTIDQGLWKHLGVYEMDAGTAPSAGLDGQQRADQPGARFSIDGAVQYALAQHADKVVFDTVKRPGTATSPPGQRARDARTCQSRRGRERANHRRQLSRAPPCQPGRAKRRSGAGVHSARGAVDPASGAEAGAGGPRQGVGLLTPCATDFLAKALGPKWEHKLFVNTELAPPDAANTPT